MSHNTHLHEITIVPLIEAPQKNGSEWDVTIIREGWSANKRWYSRDAIKRGYHLFEGVEVNVDHYKDAERAERSEGTLTRRAGRVKDVYLHESSDGRLEVRGKLQVVLPWVRESLMNAHELGWTDWAGLSIDAHGRVDRRYQESLRTEAPTVVDLVRANSVDLVTIPAAGGEIRALLASRSCTCGSDSLVCTCDLDNLTENGDGDTMDEQEIQRLIEERLGEFTERITESVADAVSAAMESRLAEADDELEMTDEELLAAIDGMSEEELLALDAMLADDDEDGYDEDYEDDESDEFDDDDTIEDAAEELAEAVREIQSLRESASESLRDLQLLEAERQIKQAVSTKLSDVPAPLRALAEERLMEVAESGELDPLVIARVTEATRGAWAKTTQANPEGVSPTLYGSVMPKDTKYLSAMAGVFAGADVDDVPAFQSLTEAYVRWTGRDPLRLHPTEMFKAMATRYDAGVDHDERTGRLTEALTTASWGDVFADVMHNQMLAQFNAHPDYNKWRNFVTRVDNTRDFQAHNVTRWGGYANLPSVAEAGPYTALTSPTDERTSFSVGKYGGTETITWEMVVNDDMGAIADIPNRLGYAAVRGLYEFVLDLITTDNPTLAYDSVALYHLVSHANDGTNALTVTGFDTAERAMMAQVPYGHPANEVLGSRGKVKNVIISREQRLRAMALFNPSSAMQVALASGIGASTELDITAFSNKGIMVHEYDGLSGTVWYGQADPRLPGMNLLIVGFLGGRQTPELWVADNPTVGANFTNDQIQYKIRFVYGGVVPDHRGYFRQTPG